MTMGQRILAARLEAGLSQRQLAGEEITRNMLSALEHDTAKPSVSTLQYLSERLCKPVGYFLGEDAPQLPELPMVEQARSCFDNGDPQGCLDALAEVQPQGAVLEREIILLQALATLALAEQAIQAGRLPYARELLNRAEEKGVQCPYLGPDLIRRIRVGQAKCASTEPELAALVSNIPEEDEILLLRARAALTDGRPDRAAAYLEAAQDRKSAQWHYLRGEVHFRHREYKAAAQCYHRAEETMDVAGKLEVCYRELGDFRMAYFYAKKGNGSGFNSSTD